MSGDDDPLKSVDRCERACALIDAANSEDPEQVQLDGEWRPKEVAHAVLVTRSVLALDPAADDAQLIAARAHHLRRWMVPRSSEPDGRAGYLRWRAAQKRRHAEEVADLLRPLGYDDAFIAEVQRIIRKEGRDHRVQTHEDALCVVFLETQLSATAERLGHARTVDIVRKTIPKMSAAGLAAARQLDLDDAAQAVLAEALVDG